tara:strand:+ start:66 stop:224 length:159 start_codon:yes stop_codon:yes gene_type:complete
VTIPWKGTATNTIAFSLFYPDVKMTVGFLTCSMSIMQMQELTLFGNKSHYYS